MSIMQSIELVGQIMAAGGIVLALQYVVHVVGQR